MIEAKRRAPTALKESDMPKSQDQYLLSSGPEGEIEAIVLLRERRLTHQGIADILGIPKSTVGNRVRMLEDTGRLVPINNRAKRLPPEKRAALEQMIIDGVRNGEQLNIIAEKFGAEPHIVHKSAKALRRAGLLPETSKSRAKRLTPEERAALEPEIIRGVEQGRNLQDIAYELGIARYTVSRIVTSLQETGQLKRENRRSKLQEALASEKEEVKRLRKKLIHEKKVNRILRGRTRKHLNQLRQVLVDAAFGRELLAQHDTVREVVFSHKDTLRPRSVPEVIFSHKDG